MENITLDNLIGQFTSNWSYRQGIMDSPILDKGNIVATDGHVLIVAPNKWFAAVYETIEDCPKFPAYQSIITRVSIY